MATGFASTAPGCWSHQTASFPDKIVVTTWKSQQRLYHKAQPQQNSRFFWQGLSAGWEVAWQQRRVVQAAACIVPSKSVLAHPCQPFMLYNFAGCSCQCFMMSRDNSVLLEKASAQLNISKVLIWYLLSVLGSAGCVCHFDSSILQSRY